MGKCIKIGKVKGAGKPAPKEIKLGKGVEKLDYRKGVR